MISVRLGVPMAAGPAPHGAGGLKCVTLQKFKPFGCPAPHGAGGLKYLGHDRPLGSPKSPAPHGAGGLKFRYVSMADMIPACPAPHGAGGLKSVSADPVVQLLPSRPARGGWIEIWVSWCLSVIVTVPPRTGRVD